MAAHSHLRLVPDSPGPDFLAILEPEAALTIDCDVCVMSETDACDDCMVSYLVGHEAGTPVVLDEAEKRAVELLADAGLVPASRFQPRPGVA
ncbi:MAG: hypothetical protein P8J50_09580 [Acidimicrobiales bacterium]|jgi:hypothetical protein|nr:hypothetical protein [Acidimicrobiales bacterium]